MLRPEDHTFEPKSLKDGRAALPASLGLGLICGAHWTTHTKLFSEKKLSSIWLSHCIFSLHPTTAGVQNSTLEITFPQNVEGAAPLVWSVSIQRIKAILIADP